MVLVLVVILPIQRLSRESDAMRVARGELWAGRALLAGADGDHDPALHQHLHDRAASVGDCAQRARMARGPAVGQLRRGVQGREHDRAPRVEHVHRARRRAGVAGHLDDGRVRHRPPADPRLARAPASCSCSG